MNHRYEVEVRWTGNRGLGTAGYRDRADGLMVEAPDGGGEFTRVALRPRVTVSAGSDVERARALHAEAAAKCFIARSVAFPVHHEPEVSVDPDPTGQDDS